MLLHREDQVLRWRHHHCCCCDSSYSCANRLFVLKLSAIMASPGDETIETAALGRPFQVGMLYDCRRDLLVPAEHLGGLVDVGGSAKYFQDTKKSDKQARMTLQYKTTTKFESLTMAHLGRGHVTHPNVFEDDTATHVVTAILYGGVLTCLDRDYHQRR
ncbi:hypothetical protein INR49_027198 [Caranx melampygus]|nr:hypothetical protein INR49_027198 [Caranx melampygus]